MRGVLRVRKWPRKRGTPKSALQRWWIDWFKQANKLAKYADGASQARAIEITKNSGMYPRDILLAAMRGRLYIWQDQFGKVWYPMAAIQDISESLDVLAQTVGSVLVRAVDRWRPAEPSSPAAGLVLTSAGVGLPPTWSSAGTGVSQIVVPGTPIVPDGTVSFYDIDVTAFVSVDLIAHEIGFAGVDHLTAQYSTDGGSTFHNGATDYGSTYLRQTNEIANNAPQMDISPIVGATGHHASIEFKSLRAGHCIQNSDAAVGAAAVSRRGGHAQFAGPITHIRLFASAGNNFNAGDFSATGIVSV